MAPLLSFRLVPRLNHYHSLGVKLLTHKKVDGHPKNHNSFSIYIGRISATCMRIGPTDVDVIRKKHHWALGTHAAHQAEIWTQCLSSRALRVVPKVAACF